MTEQEKIHIKNTVSNGISNINDPIWILAFNEVYPTLSMDVDWHYIKVLSKVLA